ncbi:MAG TPA: EAL domain-containing protein [Spongiibacteraceae bacterium]|nr:EAL domain-containing protein [Spongiibacteraceae bacterium]
MEPDVGSPEQGGDERTVTRGAVENLSLNIVELVWRQLLAGNAVDWGVALCDAQQVLLYSNPAFARQLDVQPGQRLWWRRRPRSVAETSSVPDCPAAPVMDIGCNNGDESVCGEVVQITLDGIVGHWFALKLPPVQRAQNRDDDEPVPVSELQASILEQMAVAVSVTDTRGKIVYVNRQFCEITGYAPAEVIGQNPRVLQSGRTERRIYQELWARLAAGESWEGQVLNRRKTGQTYWSFQTISPIADARGDIRWFVSFSHDSTEHQSSYLALHRLAYYDALCNIPNRRALMKHLEAVLGKASPLPVALLFIDIDNFKLINDGLGHDAGDRVLQVVSERIISANNKHAFFARLGGDEFALVFQFDDSAEALGKFVTELLKILSDTIVLDHRQVGVSASIGIAQAPLHAVTPSELMKCADSAMYAAKHGGRNRWTWFDESLRGDDVTPIADRSVLLRALAENQLFVEFQPVISSDQRCPVYLEALVRWQHPELGRMPPASFLAAFSRFGLIPQLNQYVLEYACRAMAELRWVFPFSVNICAQDLLQPNVVQCCVGILEKYGIPLTHLRLEITEGELIENFIECRRVIAELRSCGIRLYIDDFGVGYASLGYLRRLPVDGIKIDRSFLQGFPRDRQGLDIVSAIISLSHRLNLDVTVEGVETAEQVESLTDIGADYLQGFWFCRPKKLQDLISKTIIHDEAAD